MIQEYKIKVSVKAKNDLNHIIIYIKDELKEPNIAKRYLYLIKKKILNLSYYPQKYAVINDEALKEFHVRKLTVMNHIIFYRINEEKKIVNIERIIYGASNWIDKI